MIRPGDTGSDVGELQQALLEAGCSVDASELGAHSFGPSTKLAVQAFQSVHVGPDNKPLEQDGIVGPATDYALQHPGATPISRGYVAAGWRCDATLAPANLVDVILDAVADLGKHEEPDGSNDGPELAKFKTGGDAWCALAVSTWVEERYPGGSPFGRIASVHAPPG